MKRLEPRDILRHAAGVMLETLNDVHHLLKWDRESAIEVLRKKWKEKSNITRGADVYAENHFMTKMHQRLGANVRVLGEESLRDSGLDLSKEQGLTALVDMVDGTDLMALGIWLWCSAVVFFYPAEGRIVCAVVGDAFGRLYYSLGEGEAFSTDPDLRWKRIGEVLESARPIRPSRVRRVEQSYLSFYGQKRSHLEPVIQKPGLTSRFHRIYNFGGNPMMVKVADGTMSGVFELAGQHPHDVVPGAFIAREAGATVVDLAGEPLDLEGSLLMPASDDSRLRYVVACSRPLAKDLRSALLAKKQ
jgi:fructose-1,6-bisphosphatase/inositol monophosphatase family enzyme